MKKRGGARKGRGRPPGKRPTTPADLDESAVMTIRQVAEYLHCHDMTIYKLIRRHGLPGFRLGKDWRFLRSEIDTWIAKGGGGP